MAAFTYSQEDTIIGTLTNGTKLVQSTIISADDEQDPTFIIIRPIIKIFSFSIQYRSLTVGPPYLDTSLVSSNVIMMSSATPWANASGAIYSITAFGI